MGTIRYLHTCNLWVQEQTKTERTLLEKILGTENPADIFTKYLGHATMAKALKTMNVPRRPTPPAALSLRRLLLRQLLLRQLLPRRLCCSGGYSFNNSTNRFFAFAISCSSSSLTSIILACSMGATT